MVHRSLFIVYHFSSIPRFFLGIIGGIFLLFPTQISKGCDPIDRSFYGYSFLNPNIIDIDVPKAVYFAGFEKLFRQFKSTENIQQKDNIQEWYERFCEGAKREDISALVYKSSTTDLRLLKTAIQKKNGSLPIRLGANSFARILHQSKCVEAVDYLIFAKRCEPHVIARSNWNATKRDVVTMQFLIKDGRKLFRQAKSHYFKLRYAYQLIRLAHYKKDYQQTLDLYDDLMPKKDNEESLIDDWILGHKAGALMALGRNVEASYFYSQIFKNCASKRESAYRSFKINTDEEWFECLKLCKDDQERATLYALRANDQDSRVVEEMENIYELDPENEHLELLLVREMERLEKDLLGLDFNKRKKENRRYHKIPRKIAGEIVLGLQSLTRKAIAENKVKNPDLWKVADGYLELLAGDFYAAKRTLDELKGTVADPVLEEQLEAMLMVANIDGFQMVDSLMETRVVQYERDPLYAKYPDFDKFMKDKLAKLYDKNGYAGKAFLEKYSLKQLKYNPQLEIIEELIGICQKENRTKLEDEMVLKEDGLTTIESDLWDLKGNYFLGQMQLEPALEAYRQMPRKDREDYGEFNPFREEFDDCLQCRVIDTAGYTKVAILEKVIELEFKARADVERSGFYYYQIGNALYNMTYFGYAWEVADDFRSGASWYGMKTGKSVFNKNGAPFGNRETLNCSLPLYYYDRAYRAARNNELAARAAFMAAKCQQNQFFTTKGSDYRIDRKMIPYVPDVYRQYFKILQEDYSDTEFYEEIVEECLYFERYAARN